ncbi:MAG TPA: DUF5723 family protein [Lentimicrobium sp.]|nr:DUF5723 family protein [Lentimicrobium sp.]
MITMVQFSIKSMAQEMVGISNTKYNAIHGAILNPALPVLSPFYLDINIITAHVFIQNNFIYIKKEEDKFNRFLKGEVESPDNKFYYDYYTPDLKHAYTNFRLLGPSFTIIAGKNAFGLSVAIRSATSFRNIPMHVAKFLYEGLYFPPQYDIRYDQSERMSFANLEFGEFGLSFSRIIHNQGLDIWSVGGTLKILPAFAGAYAFSEHVDFEVPHYDTLTVYDADMEAGLSLPLNYETDEFKGTPLFKGFGAAMDLGIVYSRKKTAGINNYEIRRLCAQAYYPYHWRIGLSLIDLGSIRFNKNAKKLKVQNGSFFWPGIDSLKYNSSGGMITELSNRFYNDPVQLVSDDKFRIALPTSLNIHADYNFISNWFVSMVGVLPIRLSKAEVIRSSFISGGVRYENRNFHIGTNLTFDNKFYFGLNGRIGNFFIGSENILSFFKITDFTGTDLYAGIRLSMFKGKCPRFSGSACNFEEYEKFRR